MRATCSMAARARSRSHPKTRTEARRLRRARADRQTEHQRPVPLRSKLCSASLPSSQHCPARQPDHYRLQLEQLPEGVRSACVTSKSSYSGVVVQHQDSFAPGLAMTVRRLAFPSALVTASHSSAYDQTFHCYCTSRGRAIHQIENELDHDCSRTPHATSTQCRVPRRSQRALPHSLHQYRSRRPHRR